MGYRIVILTCFVFLTACSQSKKEDSNTLPLIVTTTGMIEDAVVNIVGDKANVISLMGPGVDPHLYKATQGDLEKLTSADIIFYNGLHLEGKMGEVLEKLGHIKPVIPVASKVDTSLLHRVPQFNNNFDPHIWFDVKIWSSAITSIGDFMTEYDKANAAIYAANQKEYLAKLDTLNNYVTEKINEIPENQRVLITAHDAFGYYGDAYNIEVKGLQGISTISEYGLRDVADLVDFIIKRKIKAVFVETSVSAKAINAVVEGCNEKGFNVKIGGNLFSDAMGKKGTFEGTYIGMVTTNTETIVDSLK